MDEKPQDQVGPEWGLRQQDTTSQAVSEECLTPPVSSRCLWTSLGFPEAAVRPANPREAQTTALRGAGGCL